MTTTEAAKAKRGQLAVYECTVRTNFIDARSTERTEYAPCLIISVTRDGRPSKLRNAHGVTFPVENLPGHTVHLVPEGKADPAAVMRAAAAHCYPNSTTPKPYDSPEEIRALIKAHPAPAVPAAKRKRPAAPSVLVVEKRPNVGGGAEGWAVCLPPREYSGREPIVFRNCGNVTRARILAGWLEATGYNWQAGYTLHIGHDPNVIAIATTITSDLYGAARGHNPWPEEQPEKYAALLAALRPAEDAAAA